MFRLKKPTSEQIQRLFDKHRNAPFSYPNPGCSRGDGPAGFQTDVYSAPIATGARGFGRARADLEALSHFKIGWVDAVASTDRIREGTLLAVSTHTYGLWAANLSRIVYTVDEADGRCSRYGFAYGTLGHHVERGEERFLIEWDRETDEVRYEIRAHSQPRHPLVRRFKPLARAAQKRFAEESLKRMTRHFESAQYDGTA